MAKKVECPLCLGTKSYLKSTSTKKRRRKMIECDLCDDDGLISEELAEDFITSRIVVYGRDND